MRSKLQISVAAGTLFSVVFVGLLVLRTPEAPVRCSREEEPVYTKPLYLRTLDTKGRDSKRTITLHDTLKFQRDKLSEELNKLKQKLGRMDCEVWILRSRIIIWLLHTNILCHSNVHVWFYTSAVRHYSTDKKVKQKKAIKCINCPVY